MKTYLAPTLLALLIATAGWWVVTHGEPSKEPLFTIALPSRAQELADRTIVDFGTSADGIVSYSFLDKPVPAQLVENEVPELRNESSYTTLLEEPKDGEDLKLKTIFYAQPAFARDVNGQWKYLEYATTTEQAFRDRDMTLWRALTELLVRTAYADSVSPFSGAGDGYVFNNATDSEEFCFSVWSIARDAADGLSASAIANIMYGYSYDDTVPFGCTAAMYRAFIPFDTSVIPSGASISAATLNVYATAKQNLGNDGDDFITVVHTAQATHTTLTTADFDQVGVSELIDSGERKDITSVSISAYLAFTLNSTGSSLVKKFGQSSNCSATTGITCLGLREGHDFLNTTAASNYVGFSTSEQTGTSQDPYLSVTYTVVPTGIVVGGTGTFRVSGGTVRF